MENDFLECRGIFSLCDRLDNELLWIHYTSESGFAMELNIEKYKSYLEENHKGDYYIFPISYENLKKIDLADYSIRTEVKNGDKISVTMDYAIPGAYCFAVKDKFWDYEKEWRVLLKHREFKNVLSPLIIGEEDKKKNFNDLLESRNVKFNSDIIEKVLLAPLFFNNKRFSDLINVNEDSKEKERYIFSTCQDKEERKDLYAFFVTLKEKYADCIYLMGKTMQDGVFKRVINSKIIIEEVTKDYLTLIKEN